MPPKVDSKVEDIGEAATEEHEGEAATKEHEGEAAAKEHEEEHTGEAATKQGEGESKVEDIGEAATKEHEGEAAAKKHEEEHKGEAAKEQGEGEAAAKEHEKEAATKQENGEAAAKEHKEEAPMEHGEGKAATKNPTNIRTPADTVSISFGKAQECTLKAEDCYVASLREAGTSAFGIFDGHNGRLAAAHCRDVMVPNLVDEGPPFTVYKVSDAFWNADKHLGLERVTDGTTASLLLVERKDDTPALQCTLAWLGDSLAVRINMCSEKKAAVVFKTSSHNVNNPAEVARMKANWAVRDRIVSNRGAGADGEASLAQSADRNISIVKRDELQRTASKHAPTTDEVCAAATELGLPTTATDTELLRRALEREVLMALPERRFRLTRAKSEISSRATSTNGASSPNAVLGGVQRSLSKEDREPTGPTKLGPRASVLKDIQTTWQTRQFGKVTTLVSRSIGDWDAARTLIPQPEVTSFEVGRGMCERVIIASDGLWDYCSFEKAVDIAYSSDSPQQAADRLVKQVVESVKPLKDDLTVVVVDLNLTGKPVPDIRPKARTNKDSSESSGCQCIVQ